MHQTFPLAWTPFDPWHLLVLFAIALLLFGKRLPEIGRSLGRGIMEFKKGLKDVQEEMDNVDSDRTRDSKRDPEALDQDDRKRFSEPRTPPAGTAEQRSSSEPQWRETSEAKHTGE
jgi:sec-independent protein translocase protein TatA